MSYRALKSFTGVIHARRGELKEIEDEALVNELLRLGYIESLETKPEKKGKSSKATKTKGGDISDG